MGLIGCSEDYIYYEYDGITVTRVIDGKVSYLYYGHFKKGDKLPNSYIKGYYHGYNNGMNVYLIFNPDKTVTVKRKNGWCEQFGSDSFIRLINIWDNIDKVTSINWIDSIDGNFNNIIAISDAIELEKLVDKKWNHSKVKAIYPKE
jgi:hypothetical protein